MEKTREAQDIFNEIEAVKAALNGMIDYNVKYSGIAFNRDQSEAFEKSIAALWDRGANLDKELAVVTGYEG